MAEKAVEWMTDRQGGGTERNAMSRARNIKPGFYKNEHLAECCTEARLLFPGLWMLADREGRIEWRPKRIKAEIFPFDDFDVPSLVYELVSRGFVAAYEAAGKKYLQIVNFAKHQSPHHKEVASEIPTPEFMVEPSMAQAWLKHESTLAQAPVQEALSCPTDSGLRIPDSGLLNPPSMPPVQEPLKLELRTALNRTRPEMIPIPTPLDEPAFREQWTVWTAYFLGLQPSTPQMTFEQQLVQLARWGPSKSVRAMQTSITNGWKMLKDPDERNQGNSGAGGNRREAGGTPRVGSGQKYIPGKA